MRDPMGTCSYNLLYQNVKRYSKNGEYFFKELVAVFQQRAELELHYAKGIQKLAGKLIRASKGMSNNSIFSAWCHVSDQMYSTADTHRALGNAFQQEAILELRQGLDEHHKRKRPLDNHVEKTAKQLKANWNEQLKMKKKLLRITRDHEALFNFVETNKHICTEKEKRKMLTRLTKSAETQTKLDEEYFTRNMEGHQIRLKWENTVKNCYQIIQELEKQRLEILSSTLDRYHLHMAGFGQSLLHGQRGAEQALQRVDLHKDVEALMEETGATAPENKADFLMADYFEEDSKSLMGKDRRRDAIKVKLKRLEEGIAKTKKDCEGLQRLMGSYAENPSFSNEKNLEESEQLLEETALKLDLLQATHYKVTMSLSDLEGTPRPAHPFQHSISRWKDKDCEHSVIQLTRPVKMRRSIRTRRSLRASIIYNTVKEQGAHPAPNRGPPDPNQGPPDPNHGPPDTNQGPPDTNQGPPDPNQGPPDPNQGPPDTNQGPPDPNQGPPDPNQGPPDTNQGPPDPNQGPPDPNQGPPDTNQGPPDTNQGPPNVDSQKEWSGVGTCKALYDFSADHPDELALRVGDVAEVYWKKTTGWWFGRRGAQTGHFPSAYVEELPVVASSHM